jgi:hypothetical protein
MGYMGDYSLLSHRKTNGEKTAHMTHFHAYPILMGYNVTLALNAIGQVVVIADGSLIGYLQPIEDEEIHDIKLP